MYTPLVRDFGCRHVRNVQTENERQRQILLTRSPRLALDATRTLVSLSTALAPSSRPADSRRAGGDTIVEGRAARAGYVEGRARECYGCWCGHLQQNTTIKIYRLEDTVHNNQPINFNINCIIIQLISGIILRGLVLFMVD
jgi:hypothetical protein